MKTPFWDSIEPYLEAEKMRQKIFSRLVVSVMPEGNMFRIYKPFIYYWKDRIKGKIIKITVPVGFPTDFCSIPPVVRLIIAKLGRYNGPGVIHDFLYRYHQIVVGNLVYAVNRKMADLIFLDGMRDRGVTVWKRQAMYYGVRLFAWLAWKKRR